jgi:hypothetical protein
MEKTKRIKGFNVDLYNKKVAELDNAIKILNDFFDLCYEEYGMYHLDVIDFFECCHQHPIIIFNGPLGTINVLDKKGINTDIVIKEMARIAKLQSSLFEILPYIKESYEKLFDFYGDDDDSEWGEITRTPWAMGLIVEECTEWEEKD